jgi:hypothetical protein
VEGLRTAVEAAEPVPDRLFHRSHATGVVKRVILLGSVRRGETTGGGANR